MLERTSIKNTALYDMHVKLNAKLVEFAGYKMPISYDKIISEYKSVRTKCGIFDVSHMGQIKVTGTDATKFIQQISTNNIMKISAYEAQYSVLCNEEGGLIDDLIIFKFSNDHYILIVNASNKPEVFNWLNSHSSSFSINIVDMNKTHSLIALQGPDSRLILNKITTQNIRMPFYHLLQTKLLNYNVILSRTGYTGELGYEIMAEHKVIKKLWEYFISNNVMPAGLAVRDVLRMEMKYCLYGNDINQSINPLEAGLSWVVDFSKDNFIGRNKLLDIKSRGCKQKLSGFIMLDKGIPRKNYEIYSNNIKIGFVTSGTHSPSLEKGIGLGYINSTHSIIGNMISIKIRDKFVNAKIVKTPFIKTYSLHD